MALLMLVCFTLLLAGIAQAAETPHPLSDEFISLINSKQSSWKAGRNFPLDTPLSQLRNLLGVTNPTISSLPEKIFDDIGDLPENFDSREKWPNCPSLKEIRNQGCCGSCWAFGAVEAMTDRVCIYSNGTENFHFSADDLVSCCDTCGYGCNGGYPDKAWQYWVDKGLVSGGPYNSNEGCRPYEILPKCPKGRHNSDTPKCVQKCEPSYNVPYDKDIHRGKNAYGVTSSNESLVMSELYKNGPVEATMAVYTDFFHYKRGVYYHKLGGLAGYHAVKVLGWGVEDGKKYWLCANSWSTNWGDKGFFKILRGANESEIEKYDMMAGEPILRGL